MRTQVLHDDLTKGEDFRGDYTLFIENKHFILKKGNAEYWDLDIDVGNNATFFRVIYNGKEESAHGWAKRKKIVQWG